MAAAGAEAAGRGDLVTAREAASRASEGVQAIRDSLPPEHLSKALCTLIQTLIQRATTAEQASALAQREVVALRESAAAAAQPTELQQTTACIIALQRSLEQQGNAVKILRNLLRMQNFEIEELKARAAADTNLVNVLRYNLLALWQWQWQAIPVQPRFIGISPSSAPTDGAATSARAGTSVEAQEEPATKRQRT